MRGFYYFILFIFIDFPVTYLREVVKLILKILELLNKYLQKINLKFQYNNTKQIKCLPSRLKDAIDKQKVAQSQRSKHTSGSKVDQVVSWIAGELDIIMNVVDANYCLVHLSEVRDSVKKRLTELKSQTINEAEGPSEEVTACEEELEMRNAQISDLKQKVNTTDIESKIKGICEHIQSMPEARAALKQLFSTVADLRRELAPKDNKIEEIKGLQEMSEEKIQELEREKDTLGDEIKKLERKHLEELSKFEKNCEEKIAVLIRHTEPKGNDETNDEWKRMQSETLEKLEKLRDENEQLHIRISHVEELEGFKRRYLDLEKKLDKLRAKDLKVGGFFYYKICLK